MRQVYFDPFGKYVEGYDQGASRQLQTEKAVREARDQDYEYRVNAPLRSQVLGSEARVNTTIEPYRVSMAQANSGIRQQEMASGGYGLAETAANDTNDPSIAVQHMAIGMGLTPVFSGDTYTLIGAHGQPVSSGSLSELRAHLQAPRQSQLNSAEANAYGARSMGDYRFGSNLEKMDAAELRFRGLEKTVDGRIIVAGMRNNPNNMSGFDPYGGQTQDNDFTNPGGIVPRQQPAAQPQNSYNLPATNSVPAGGVPPVPVTDFGGSMSANRHRKPSPGNSFMDDPYAATRPPKARPRNSVTDDPYNVYA